MRTPILAVALAAALACSGSKGGSNGGSLAVSESEPNDTPATATPLPAGGAIAVGTISTVSDVDYYSFTVPAGAFVELDAATYDTSGVTCNGIDTVLRLYNSTPSLLTSDSDSGVDLCSLIHTDLGQGTYTIAVASQYGTTTFSYLLDVTLTQIPVVAETEPNDDGSVASGTNDFSAANANGPFSSDVIVTGSISPSGDEDVYAVANTSAAPATVRFETYVGGIGLCSSGDTYLYIRNAAGTVLWSDDDSGIGLCSRLTYTIPAGTTVYAHVTAFADSGTINGYLLRMDFP